jgi:hypothetical protein
MITCVSQGSSLNTQDAPNGNCISGLEIAPEANAIHHEYGLSHENIEKRRNLSIHVTYVNYVVYGYLDEN